MRSTEGATCLPAEAIEAALQTKTARASAPRVAVGASDICVQTKPADARYQEDAHDGAVRAALQPKDAAQVTNL